MQNTFARAIAAAILLSAPAVGAQGIMYSPGTTRYRVSSESKSSQTMQGQTQEATTSSDQFITVTVNSKSRDTLQYVITLDSGSAKSSSPMIPIPDINKLRGFKYVGTMSRLGKRYGGMGSDTTTDGSKDLALGFERFFLAIPQGAKAGVTWTDSNSTKVNRSGIDILAETKSNYQLVGDTMIAGQKAWKIARTSNVTTTGNGVSQGQVITLESVGKIAGSVYITSAGLYLSSYSSQDQVGKVTVPAMSLDIPQTVSITTKAEILK